MRWVAIVSCAALLHAGTVSAGPINLTQQTPGWTYFYRAGATIQTSEGELRSCLLTASTVPPYPGGFWYSGPGLVESVLANVIGGVIDGRKETVRLRSNTENCMVVQGWEVVRVPDDEGRQISSLKREELAARLSEWIGSGQPHGEVVRRWGNESDKRAGITTEKSSGSAPVSLSLLALTPDDHFLKEMANPVRSTPKISKGQMTPVSIPLNQIGSAPRGSAVIIITLRGPAKADRMITFWRSTPDLSEPAWTDGQPYAFAASMAKSSQLGQSRCSVVPWIAILRGFRR
jgi:hypothetical protein